MSYSAPTVAALALFTGRPQATYTTFAEQALIQSSLLFALVTGVSDVPDNADQAQLIEFAIMEMADDIYLKQPFVALKAKPFQSETIGSYSYSMGSSAAKTLKGEKTGLLWWDLALKQLGQITVISSGGIAVFNVDHNVWQDSDGNLQLVGPADVSRRGLTYNDLNVGYPGDYPNIPPGFAE